MHCPACKDTSLITSERAGIEVDYCPNCRGIWLDRGELDKIIERSATEALGPGAAHREQHAQPAHKQKRNLITELFDF
ncbi:zf-TFIIB domain-containing protein [Microbulbifer guangxiensis]|uniref:TFIIB-type zinc ribbon-containing protein n=1 Tax=Microbulbifer guangxiensis TaxID=2904249 RepID=UPI001F286C37|nr:zf-TFIIB domain-containing protein [Microbulbifer guangxiensis]